MSFETKMFTYQPAWIIGLIVIGCIIALFFIGCIFAVVSIVSFKYISNFFILYYAFGKVLHEKTIQKIKQNL